MSLLKVAKQAGVSVATVSRAINNKPGISDNTREAVMRIMVDLGYEPKPLASRTGPKSSIKLPNDLNNVLFLSFTEFKSFVNSPVYAEIIHGVEAELTSRGKTMLFRQVTDDEDLENWISSRDIDGLILFAPTDKIIERVKPQIENLPVVSILCHQRQEFCDKISYDLPLVAEKLFEYIYSRGHKEVLEIHDGSRHSVRLRELCRKNGIRFDTLASEEEVIVINENENRPNQQALSAKLDQYLSKNKLPKAIFAPCDALVMPIYSMLMKKGLIAGRDFEVVSVNNEKSLLDGLMPRPATVDIRSYEMGKAAVQRLVWRRSNPEEPVMTLTIAPQLVEPKLDF